MPYPKKILPVTIVLTMIILFWLFKPMMLERRWGAHEVIPSHQPAHAIYHGKKKKVHQPQAAFVPGIVKPAGENYTKMLVIPRTKDEDINWISEAFKDNANIQSTIYTVNDPTAENHPPRNKGHEAMVYISYIIDNYYNLSDVTLFMHSHQYTWHNNYLLDNDAAQMVARLSAERVVREGYMNLRCNWDPGCPAWMHPGTVEEDVNKQEEVQLARSWSELFPLDPMPKVLAQPCCAQFAISRERIRTLPLAKYVFYRDWLLKTKLPDFISGRVWEYVWQFVFTGRNVVCPLESVCLCDGFGVCFGTEKELWAWYAKDEEWKALERLLEIHSKQVEETKALIDEGKQKEAEDRGIPDPGREEELKKQIKELQDWCNQRKEEAIAHGDVASNRAEEAGRDWKDGDGF
ncbi:histone-lysine n-methyltransferase 2b protein [Rutstroemia sp. NJR-2017a BVV2]|nr:histone-lysine n-methyltransferase 2b protein [Rutstroemia sp. NJR-2017a BVV2]